MIDYYDRLEECDWGHAANRFCDFSAVTDFDFDHHTLRDLASLRKRKLVDHADILLVTFSSSPLGFGMARMYQTFMADYPIRTHVERNLDRCAEILGVPVSRLSSPVATSPQPVEES